MMKSSTTSKTAKKKRNNNRRRNESTIINGNRGPFVQNSSTALSYENVIKNPLKFTVMGKGLHNSDWGEAIRCVGTQQAWGIGYTTTTTGVLQSGTASTQNNGNYAFINPGNLNERIGYFAAIYQRYAFRKIIFHYITKASSTQTGSFAMCVVGDGGLFLASQGPNYLNYSQIQSFTPSLVLPYRVEYQAMEYRFTGSRTWYTTFDNNLISAGAEDLRQTVQCILAANADMALGSVNSLGDIYLEYEVDFYSPQFFNVNIPLLRFGNETAKSLVRVHEHMKTMEEEEVKKFKSILNENISSAMKVFSIL